MTQSSVARLAFGIMANEAVKHASDARARNDTMSAVMFQEIAEMMIAAGQDLASPLSEVLKDRQQTNAIGKNVEFRQRRTLLVALAMWEMETAGVTRHAACKTVCDLAHRRDGSERARSAAKELARHLPERVEDFGRSPTCRDSYLNLTMIRDALRTQTEGGAEPPSGLVRWALARMFGGWRELGQRREDRIATLRTCFNSPASRPLATVDLNALGRDLLSSYVAEVRTPF